MTKHAEEENEEEVAAVKRDPTIVPMSRCKKFFRRAGAKRSSTNAKKRFSVVLGRQARVIAKNAAYIASVNGRRTVSSADMKKAIAIAQIHFY